MFREYRLMPHDDGWFLIEMRDTPRGPWRCIARVWGNYRASQVIDAFRDGRIND